MSGSFSGFRSMVQTLAQQAFQIAGDLPDAVVYNSNAAPAYDPVAGVATPQTTVYRFNGAVVKFNLQEVDSAAIRSDSMIDSKIVVSTDAKLLAAYLDLPVEPSNNDTLTAQGKTWKVIRVLGTPGNALWSIHIRRT